MRIRPTLGILVVLGILAGPHGGQAGDVSFEGNALFSRAALLNALRRYRVDLSGEFGRTDADDAAFFLREFYFTQGFRDAEVTYTYSAPPSKAVFVIDEGARFSIGTVRFEGSKILEQDELKVIFSAAIRQATLRPFGRLRFVESAIDTAKEEILRALSQEGHLGATVEVTPAAASANMIDLVLHIDDGPKYMIRHVRLSGVEGVSEEAVRRQIADFLAQPYRRNTEVLMRTRVQEFLRNEGYFGARTTVSPVINPSTGEVDIRFDLIPGDRYTIGKILVDGNRRTRMRSVLSRFAVKSGQQYSAAAVNEGARRLWFSGAFSEAEVYPEPQAGGIVDLRLQLEESKAKQLRFQLGYSEWFRGFGEIHYVDRNFAGSLYRFSADAAVSTRSYSFSTALSDPWLFGLDRTGSFGLYTSRRELPAYRSTEYGATLGLQRQYDPTNLTGYRVQLGWKRVTDAQVFGKLASPVDSDYALGSLVVSQTYDRRNDVLSPMQGFYLSHEIAGASSVLLGDFSFFRFEGHFTYYLPFRKITAQRPFVPFLVFNHRIGLVVPFGGTVTVPVQERLFLGGPDTVRGYQLDGLGSKDSAGVPLGGMAMVLANLEFQMPLYRNLYIAVFTDGGNLAGAIEDLSLAATRFSSGAGVRVYTPLGAIRVDYGYNLNPGPGDPIGAWQFGFGFTF